MEHAPSLDGRCFAAVAPVDGGDVGPATVFHYRERDGIISAHYAGGDVVTGNLVGTRTGDTLAFRYVQVRADGSTASGRCRSQVVVAEDGRLRLDETWSWESQPGSGTSQVVEVTPTEPTDDRFLAIGVVISGRDEPIDDGWDAIPAVIRLDGNRFTPAAIQGLDAFSHIEVVYRFDRVTSGAVATGARRPRGNPDWPEVGIFAQRAKDRPNRLGVTRCRLVGVDGLDIHVSGLDAINGTPVLDIKPELAGFAARGDVTEPNWSQELMDGYW